MDSSQLCLCCSRKPYKNCCQSYHQGALPKTALELMRSRYSAYALGLIDYIINTTYSKSPYFVADRKQWLLQLRVFCEQVSFNKLEIIENQNGNEESFVTFIAHLHKGAADLTFTERSRFLKEGLAWKYVDGQIAKGKLTAAQIRKK